MNSRKGTTVPTSLVAASGIVVALYLGFTGWRTSGTARPDLTPADVDSSPLREIVVPVDTLSAATANVGAHLDSLRSVVRAVAPAELAAVSGDLTLREALPVLRPYWLEFTEERFRVDVGGQLVGQEALDRIRVGTVIQLRLVFDRADPHWILRVDFR